MEFEPVFDSYFIRYQITIDAQLKFPQFPMKNFLSTTLVLFELKKTSYLLMKCLNEAEFDHKTDKIERFIHHYPLN